jgi:hypothetical protein
MTSTIRIIPAVMCITLVAWLYLSCDDITTPPRDPRAVFPQKTPEPEKEAPQPPPTAATPAPKSKAELIQLYFFIKNAKQALEEKAGPMVASKGKDDRKFKSLWPHWKKFTSDVAPTVILRIGTHSPAGLDLPPDHPQVLLWLALKKLNQEFEMYNRFFSLNRPLKPGLSKELDMNIEECYKALEAYHEPEE